MQKRDIPLEVFYSKSALRIAKLAHRDALIELEKKSRNLLCPSNPNHPDYDNKMFGYDEREFLAKQYK